MNIGQLPESLPHFDRALAYLGERMPRSAVEVQARFAANLAAVLAGLFVLRGTRRLRSGTERDREFFEILSARARASVTSDPRRIFYDNIGGVRRMNGIDPSSFAPACAMYAVAGGMFSFSGLSFGIARRFLARAVDCRKDGSLGDTFDCRALAFTIDYLEGNWREEDLLEPDLLDEAVRNGRFWDVQNYLGLACDRLQRQGRFADAQQHFARLAELRDTYEFKFAGTNHDGESAMCHLERRQLGEAHAAVERYLDGRNEYALRVLALGTKARILTHLGDRSGAAGALEEAEDILAGSAVIPPWHASAHAVARLLFDVEEAAATRGPRRAVALRRAADSRRRALGVTRAVASQRTETLRLAGTSCWLESRRSAAMRFWSRSMRFGEKLGARPELARTWLEVSRRLDSSQELAGVAGSEYRRRAEQAFVELDLAWDLASATAESTDSSPRRSTSMPVLLPRHT